MIKREELSNPASCMSRAREDEMTFVLLGRDAAAPVAIRAWIAERIRLGKNKPDDAQINEAFVCARRMEQPCQWCAEGNQRIRSSVSEAYIHTDTPTGRRICKAETSTALPESPTASEAPSQSPKDLEGLASNVLSETDADESAGGVA